MRPTLSLHDITAVVVSAGRMMQAAKVRTTKQIYNARIQKHFTISRHHLVSDPTSALRTGDVIRMAPERHSRLIRHVVTAIIAPAGGEPIEERPAVLTAAEREGRREAKAERRRDRESGREGRKDDGERGRGGGDKEGEGGVTV